MNQEMVKAEKRFANHKARLDILDENVRVLNWRQPGTQAYAIRAVMDGYHVYITGDLGSAVICLTDLFDHLSALSNCRCKFRTFGHYLGFPFLLGFHCCLLRFFTLFSLPFFFLLALFCLLLDITVLLVNFVG